MVMNQPRQFIKRARSLPKPKENAPPWVFCEGSQDEDTIQTALFMWIRIATKFGFEVANDEMFYKLGAAHHAPIVPVPELAYMFAIPNGGSRDGHTAQILKQTGVKPGVSDMFLPVPKTHLIERSAIHTQFRYAGLWLELKTDIGTPQKNQEDWRDAMRAQGYAAHIVYGFYQARDCIQWYLS